MSQVRYILGYRVPRKDSLHEQIAVLVQNRAGFKWQVGGWVEVGGWHGLTDVSRV